MKKRVLLGTTLLSMLILGACSKEDAVAPTTAATVLYPSPVVKMGLDIHVKASSVASTSRVAGLSGATVTAKQNGKTFTATTDESGIATFADLTEGDVSYFVMSPGFAKINGITSLYYDGTPNVNGTNGNATSGSVTVNNTQTYSESVSVTLSRLGASVSGVVMGDLDGSGAALTTTIPSGNIILKLNSTDIEPNVFKASISSGGVYSFSNLPEGQAYKLYTEGVNSTIPATTNTPSYSLNLDISFSSTTPMVGKTQNNGISYLND